MRRAPLYLRNAAAAQAGTVRQLLLRESRRQAVPPQQDPKSAPRTNLG
jgi:hypothetical protein